MICERHRETCVTSLDMRVIIEYTPDPIAIAIWFGWPFLRYLRPTLQVERQHEIDSRLQKLICPSVWCFRSPFAKRKVSKGEERMHRIDYSTRILSKNSSRITRRTAGVDLIYIVHVESCTRDDTWLCRKCDYCLYAVYTYDDIWGVSGRDFFRRVSSSPLRVSYGRWSPSIFPWYFFKFLASSTVVRKRWKWNG